MHISSNFPPSARGMVTPSFFEANRRYKIPRGTPRRGHKIPWGEKTLWYSTEIGDYPGNNMRRAHGNSGSLVGRHRNPIDPRRFQWMTLMDLESPAFEAPRGAHFPVDLRTVWPRTTTLGTVIHMGEGRIPSPCPCHKGRGRSVSKFLGPPVTSYTCAHTVGETATKFLHDE